MYHPNQFIVILITLGIICVGNVSGQSMTRRNDRHQFDLHDRSIVKNDRERHDTIRQTNQQNGGGDDDQQNQGDDSQQNQGDDDQVIDDYIGKAKKYVRSNANEGYHTTPSNWGTHQWVVFSAAMIFFGITFCLSCVFCVIPCCCPRAGQHYVRML